MGACDPAVVRRFAELVHKTEGVLQVCRGHAGPHRLTISARELDELEARVIAIVEAASEAMPWVRVADEEASRPDIRLAATCGVDVEVHPTARCAVCDARLSVRQVATGTRTCSRTCAGQSQRTRTADRERAAAAWRH